MEVQLAHVGDVEQAGVVTHRRMLGQDRAVLDRELEAGEGNEAAAERAVGLEQGGVGEGAHALLRSPPRRSR